ELFEGWGASLRQTASSVLPVLQTGLVGAADALNRMGLEVSASARALADNGSLGAALRGANRGMRNLATVPGALLESIVTLAAGAAPAFERLTRSAARAADDIRERLNSALASGGLEDAINTATDVAQQFWSVLKNVGTALGNIFGPAAEVGGGILGTLEQVTGMLAELTGTDAAQEALTSLFEIAHTVAAVFTNNLGAALSAVLPLIAAVGNAFSGPLADAAERLMPVFEDIADAIGDALLPAVETLS